MKIGIDARFYRKETGGIGRYTRSLIKELFRIDQENQYTIYITPKDKAEYERLAISNKRYAKNFQTKVIDIIHYTLDEQIKFLKILNCEKFDLVHFLNFNHPIFYNRPFITTIHDLTMLLYPVGRMQRSIIRRLSFKAVMSNAVKKAKKVITVSNSTRDDCIKYLSADSNNIKVIYEAVDPAKSGEIPSTKFEAQNKLQIANCKLQNKTNLKSAICNLKFEIREPYLLFVSQWRPHKGLPQLIEAFEILKKKYHSSTQLVIIGKPNLDFPKIINSIKKSKYNKDIITPGFVSEQDLIWLYQNATLFVFPSLYEGFGLPPLEAMAHGTPVLSSNLSCMPEVLGNAAQYFDPDNIEGLAQKINQIMVDKKLQAKMSMAGLEQVKKYSWTKMAWKTLKVYQEILSA